MSDTKPNIDNLPLDLFGDQARATEAGPSASATLGAPPAAGAAAAATPSMTTLGPGGSLGVPPAASSAPFGSAPTGTAATLPAVPVRLQRLYDAAGILGMTVVLGTFFGAFEWRVLAILLLNAGLYFVVLKKQRSRYYARMEQWRARVERVD